MEYKIVRTIQGPAIMGDDEVLFIGQFQQLVDYIDSDPNFLINVKQHIADEIRKMGNDISDSLFKPVVGGDQVPTLYQYLNALNVLGQLEHGFMPTLAKR